MQKCIPRLKVEHILQANGMIKELKDLKAWVKFKAPQRYPIDATVNSFSDAVLTRQSFAAVDNSGSQRICLLKTKCV